MTDNIRGISLLGIETNLIIVTIINLIYLNESSWFLSPWINQNDFNYNEMLNQQLWTQTIHWFNIMTIRQSNYLGIIDSIKIDLLNIVILFAWSKSIQYCPVMFIVKVWTSYITSTVIDYKSFSWIQYSRHDLDNQLNISSFHFLLQTWNQLVKHLNY